MNEDDDGAPRGVRRFVPLIIGVVLLIAAAGAMYIVMTLDGRQGEEGAADDDGNAAAAAPASPPPAAPGKAAGAGGDDQAGPGRDADPDAAKGRHRPPRSSIDTASEAGAMTMV